MNDYRAYVENLDESVYHHGVKGQKWGKRRYQNEDGSLTPEGKRRLGIGLGIGLGAAALAGGAALYAHGRRRALMKGAKAFAQAPAAIKRTKFKPIRARGGIYNPAGLSSNQVALKTSKFKPANARGGMLNAIAPGSSSNQVGIKRTKFKPTNARGGMLNTQGNYGVSLGGTAPVRRTKFKSQNGKMFKAQGSAAQTFGPSYAGYEGKVGTASFNNSKAVAKRRKNVERINRSVERAHNRAVAKRRKRLNSRWG